MKISDLIDILTDYNKNYGDVEVTGACDSCQTEGLIVTVITNDADKTVAIQLEEEGWDNDDNE